MTMLIARFPLTQRMAPKVDDPVIPSLTMVTRDL